MKNPSKLVPSLETCQRLKAAGWSEPTYFDWHYYDIRDVWEVEPADVHWTSETIAAPTLAELLDALPGVHRGGVLEMDRRGREYQFDYISQRVGWLYHYDNWWTDNPAEAAALLWLRLQEQVAERETT